MRPTVIQLFDPVYAMTKLSIYRCLRSMKHAPKQRRNGSYNEILYELLIIKQMYLLRKSNKRMRRVKDHEKKGRKI